MLYKSIPTNLTGRHMDTWSSSVVYKIRLYTLTQNTQKRFQLSQHIRLEDTTKMYSTSEHNTRNPTSPSPHTEIANADTPSTRWAGYTCTFPPCPRHSSQQWGRCIKHNTHTKPMPSLRHTPTLTTCAGQISRYYPQPVSANTTIPTIRSTGHNVLCQTFMLTLLTLGPTCCL